MPRLPLRLLPPVAAFVVVRLAHAVATGTAPWMTDPSAFGRWDSGNYYEIAAHGYRWASCVEQNRPLHGEVCSTAAWYPGYPFLSRAVSWATGWTLDTSLVLVAQVGFLALLVIVWLGLLDSGGVGDERRWPRPKAVVLLALVAFFPGGIYLLGAFPLSLLVALLALQVSCFVRGRWWWGALAGAAASLFYPITAVLPVGSAVWAFLAGAGDRRARVVRAAGVGAVVLTGTLVVFGLHQVVLGDWSAPLDEQRRFGGTLYNPVLNWAHVVIRRNSWIQLDAPVTAWPIAAQTVLVTALVAVCAYVVVRGRHQPDRTQWRHELGLLVLLLALWLLPLASNIETGLYRRVLPLLLGVWILRRACWPAVTALTTASVAVWFWMVPLFHSADLI